LKFALNEKQTLAKKAAHNCCAYFHFLLFALVTASSDDALAWSWFNKRRYIATK
jgi:hypothetical protein